ncbi:MAG: hypothetical protein AAB502_08915 [Chloroflexota bacterium]
MKKKAQKAQKAGQLVHEACGQPISKVCVRYATSGDVYEWKGGWRSHVPVRPISTQGPEKTVVCMTCWQPLEPESQAVFWESVAKQRTRPYVPVHRSCGQRLEDVTVGTWDDFRWDAKTEEYKYVPVEDVITRLFETVAHCMRCSEQLEADEQEQFWTFCERPMKKAGQKTSRRVRSLLSKDGDG